MHFNTPTLVLLGLLAGHTLSAPLDFNVPLRARQSAICFLPGNIPLPAETQDAVNALADTITCGTSKTIGNVPDVTSGSVTFSDINFAASKSTPLQFALDKFATANPLASTDLADFQYKLDVYVATEAGIRSEGGSLAIKIPKFTLSFQVARIKTAQGIAITDPGQTVEHLLGKVLSNAKNEDKALLDQVRALSTTLA